MASAQSPFDLGELVQRCIEFLGNSDSDLRACALVSRSWVYGAQSCIFRDIRFTSYSDDTESAWNRLQQILHRSPHLVHHIRQLHLKSGAVSDAAFSTICSLPFTQLSYVDIDLTDDVPGLGVTTVEQLLSLTSLRRLRIVTPPLVTVNELFQLWDRCSHNIRHLELAYLQPSGALMDSFPPRRSTPIALHSLRIPSLRYIADWLMHNRCPLDISHLKILSLPRTTGDVLRFRATQVLDMGVADYCDVIDLTLLPSLALVRMAVLPQGLQVALDILSTIPTPNCMQKIVIHTTLINRGFAGRLESQLESLSMHPVITLELEIDSIRGGLTVNNLDEYFPHLTSRNMVRVVEHERNWFENFTGL
ncbi:hypothetical protein FB451DRAFT_665770 [Mycena latifolia]|nr:hypothetical protein FB451DRAFT_665770 [Mycena latifolia]